jgi:hypothetical protein
MNIKRLAFYFGLVLITALAAIKPNYNWDCLPYMAIVLDKTENLSNQELHNKVYEQAQVHIPEKQYAMLVAETPYRTSMQQNADAFKQQLPFYHIKPLYIGLCWLSYSVGFNLAFATVIPSLLAFFGIGLLLFFWLNKFVSEKQSILITCCILLTMPFTGIGRESSPDALSCFFIVLASYWFYIKKCWQWIAPALALAVLTRPDNIIFVGLLGTVLFAKKYWSITYILIVLGFSMLAFIIPKLYLTSYNWQTLFYHSFIIHLTFPADTAINLNLSDYIFTIARNAFREFNISLIPLLLIFAIPAWNNRKKLTTDLSILWLTIGLTILLRYLLFPVFTGRFMAPYYLIAILLIINQLQKYYNPTHEIN